MSAYILNRGIISYIILNPLDTLKGARPPRQIRVAERITNNARTARPYAIFKAT
jgi:hypothetical protein